MLSCPSCGAPLPPRPPNALAVACEYCGAFSAPQRDEMQLEGECAKLVESPTRFAVWQKVEIGGTQYEVLGRARYEYEDGFWDEWALSDGAEATAWLQEDEGELVLFDGKVDGPPVDLSGARPLSTVAGNGASIFVTEVGRAKVVGGQGWLTNKVAPHETFDYVDGNASGQQAILLSTGQRSLLLTGRALDHGDITIRG